MLQKYLFNYLQKKLPFRLLFFLLFLKLKKMYRFGGHCDTLHDTKHTGYLRTLEEAENKYNN